MSEASTLPDLLPSPKGLRLELKLLAQAIRDDLQRGEKHGAAFVRFTTKAFQKGEDASCAAKTLVEIFRDRLEVLEVVARAVDVALELQCGCAVLASKVVQLWDQPKADHKLARLADEILTETTRYQNDPARAFILDLARRLALQRPELAGRLIEMMPETANGPEAGTVRIWLKCGAFLRSQNESVRFFWERHLRDPKQLKDWDRSSVRPSVAAVRTALMDAEVREMFQNSVPAEVWTDTRPAVETKPVPVQPRSQPLQAVPGLSTPAIHAAVANHLRRARTGMAMKQLGHGLLKSRMIAGLVTCGALLCLMMGNKPETAVEAGDMKTAPSQRVKMVDKPSYTAPKIKLTGTQASSQLVVKPKGGAPPNTNQSAGGMAAAPPSEPVRATNTVVTMAGTVKPDHVNDHPSAPLISSAGSLALPNASSSAEATPSAKSSAERHPPVPAVIVARPAMLTNYDRWLIVEFRKVAQRYPELIEMQRSVVIGTWNPSALYLSGMRPVTADHERYAALVRWLVIDPPLLAETRKGVLGTWTNVVTPDECIDLWEELLERRAIHRVDIERAALEWLKRPGMALSTSQRLRLQRIVAGELD